MFKTDIKPEDFAELLCSLIPQDILKSQENVVFGRTVTFRDRFVRYCYVYWRYPKYPLEESKEKILKILETTNILSENGRIRMEAFNDLLLDGFGFLERKKKKKKS